MKIQWIVDKNGIRVKNKVIIPILVFIKNVVNKYNTKLQLELQEKAKISIIDKMTDATDLIGKIGDLRKTKSISGIANKINKYIANHFFLNQTETLLRLENKK